MRKDWVPRGLIRTPNLSTRHEVKIPRTATRPRAAPPKQVVPVDEDAPAPYQPPVPSEVRGVPHRRCVLSCFGWVGWVLPPRPSLAESNRRTI